MDDWPTPCRVNVRATQRAFRAKGLPPPSPDHLVAAAVALYARDYSPPHDQVLVEQWEYARACAAADAAAEQARSRAAQQDDDDDALVLDDAASHLAVWPQTRAPLRSLTFN